MSKWVLACWLLAAASAFAETPGFTLQGRITADKPSASIRVVLEDPKASNVQMASADTDTAGHFSIPNLQKRSYRLVTLIDGKRQDRRDVEILCRPGASVSKDFHYGRSASSLVLQFPSEDPDVVDVAELHGDYPKEVLRDYEKAFQDHINGNPSRAIERLDAIVTRAPGFYGAHARLGLIYQQEGCFFDAETEYLRASALSPRSPQPLLNLASVEIRAADAPGERDRMVSRALATLAKVLEIRPSSAIAHCLSGAARVKVSAFEEAEKDFKRALDYDGGLRAARLMLANLYLAQQNWNEGIENLKVYLEDFPFAPDRSVVKEMLSEARNAGGRD